MFQPTLPLRGATSARPRRGWGRSGFNPRSPCGERRALRAPFRATTRFNPRSPCGERPGNRQIVSAADVFQPTLPLRGATHSEGEQVPAHRGFNPRSPCGERPLAEYSTITNPLGFNPRSPCGERQVYANVENLPLDVSTHAPLAGSDGDHGRQFFLGAVSTHAPLAGSDSIH